MPAGSEVPGLVEHFCQWINTPELSGDAGKWGSATPVVRAALAHLNLAVIHPFFDGNGRTARTVETSLMLAGGVAPDAIARLRAFYSSNACAYYHALSDVLAAVGQGEPKATGQFVALVVDGLTAAT